MARSMESLRYTLQRRARGRSAHYADIQDGLWTPPVKIGRRSVAWPSDETDRLIAARIAGHSDDEIRQLVRQLMLERELASWDLLMIDQSSSDLPIFEQNGSGLTVSLSFRLSGPFGYS